eukprot:TCALIF_08887-PA protein Name:"Similar to GATAD1 GATA zinc finger domain-containing protein 1 (Homo sapiens)" AED:0.01 eAED:0.01 QI:298/1/0.66/1/1/1/3/0/406
MARKSNPPQESGARSKDPESPGKVDKVAVAVRHPGVFMETEDLEKEIGQKLEKGVVPEAIDVKSTLKSVASHPVDPSTSPDQEIDQPHAGEEVKVEDGSEDLAQKVKAEPEYQPAKADEDVIGEEIEIAGKSTPAKTRSSISTRRSKKLEEQSRPAPLKPAMSVESHRETPMEDTVPSGEGLERVKSSSLLDDDHSEVDSIGSEIRDDSESVASGSTLTTRSSNRRKRDPAANLTKKAKLRAAHKNKSASLSGKGKSRRFIFKKSSIRAPTSVARALTSDRVFYKGQCFTTGDIVSVTDIEGGIYYAQLRGFLTDQYCEKSGVISWLLPTVHSPLPEDGFDAGTYVIGPEEELPRKLECFTFVMHAPDDYFYYKYAPYPTRSVKPDQEYLMTRAGPKVRLINHGKA